MDNFEIELTAETPKTLKEAFGLVFRHNAPGGKATHWAEIEMQTHPEWFGANSKRKALVLYWHEENQEGLQRFPVALGPDNAAEMVLAWLQEADYGSEPDHDGSNHKGFRLFCDHWGHVEKSHYGIVGVVPAWAMYGK